MCLCRTDNPYCSHCPIQYFHFSVTFPVFQKKPRWGFLFFVGCPCWNLLKHYVVCETTDSLRQRATWHVVWMWHNICSTNFSVSLVQSKPLVNFVILIIASVSLHLQDTVTVGLIIKSNTLLSRSLVNKILGASVLLGPLGLNCGSTLAHPGASSN